RIGKRVISEAISSRPGRLPARGRSTVYVHIKTRWIILEGFSQFPRQSRFNRIQVNRIEHNSPPRRGGCEARARQGEASKETAQPRRSCEATLFRAAGREARAR